MESLCLPFLSALYVLWILNRKEYCLAGVKNDSQPLHIIFSKFSLEGRRETGQLHLMLLFFVILRKIANKLYFGMGLIISFFVELCGMLYKYSNRHKNANNFNRNCWRKLIIY